MSRDPTAIFGKEVGVDGPGRPAPLIKERCVRSVCSPLARGPGHSEYGNEVRIFWGMGFSFSAISDLFLF